MVETELPNTDSFKRSDLHITTNVGTLVLADRDITFLRRNGMLDSDISLDDKVREFDG